MLKIVLPKGSLEQATLDLFDSADLAVIRSSKVDYKANIDDPRVDEVRILRPQEIPTYISDGLFDIGITGRDWIEETESDDDDPDGENNDMEESPGDGVSAAAENSGDEGEGDDATGDA